VGNMDTTTNLSLKKPEMTDDALITDINDNMDTLDTHIKALEDVDHPINKDQYLDYGGANQVAVADIKDAVTKKHERNHDQGLDEGGANAVVVADIKDAVTKKHTAASDDNFAGLTELTSPSGSNKIPINDGNYKYVTKDNLLNVWIVAPTLTYSAADAPTYTVTCTGDYSSIIMPGMRMKMTQGGSLKYFIVVKSEYSSPNTTLTLYGGTNYTLGSTITLPYYSMVKSPPGFPLDPAKWTVTVTDTSERSKATPTPGTWYNLGSISINVPIGLWTLKYVCIGQIEVSSSWLDMFISLSTANNSASDSRLTCKIYLNALSQCGFNATMDAIIAVTSKTTYYLIAKTGASTATGIYFKNADSNAVITAVCAYL